MIFFIDTEFTDFKDAHLLSVGICSAEGKTFYFERNDYPVEKCNIFVLTDVLPCFEQNPSTTGTIIQLREKINDFFHPYNKIEWALDFVLDWYLLIGLLNKENLKKLKIFNISKFSAFYSENIDDYFVHLNLKRHHALNDAIVLQKAFLAMHQDPRQVHEYTEVYFKHLIKS